MIITESHGADPEKGIPTKSISKPYCRATAMPPAWELKLKFERLGHSFREMLNVIYFRS